MYRRTLKHTRKEFSEIDYLPKLSNEDYDWMRQFLLEYYQADFNYEKPIHPQELRKDCRDRNNAAKRQLHSVGYEILDQSIRKAFEIQKGTDNALKSRFYTIADYLKDYEG